jgi:hypothetical protein
LEDGQFDRHRSFEAADPNFLASEMASAALIGLAGKSAFSAYLVLLREQERTENNASNARAADECHILAHGCALENSDLPI